MWAVSVTALKRADGDGTMFDFADAGDDRNRAALGRRDLFRLGLGIAVTGALMSPDEAMAVMRAPSRVLNLYNTHTGEKTSAEYWVKGSYVRSSLKMIDRVMRDHRSGDTHRIDPGLLDQVYMLSRMVRRGGAVHIISGYRSPETNAAMREESDGVARHSYHMEGRAVDIRFPGLSVGSLRRAALTMRAGGVGYYPRSGFVHIDTGPVRRW